MMEGLPGETGSGQIPLCGLEWNARVHEIESPALIKRVEGAASLLVLAEF